MPLGPEADKEIQKIKNPVVITALFEIRKLVNEIIDAYGKPNEIKVELARDLKVSKKNRNDTRRKQQVLEKENDRVKGEIEKLGMTAYLAVNQGSLVPPKLIYMKYQGKETWENPIALVGKGLTFDTGGYNLKPNSKNMKTDMGGSAAVLGAIEAIAGLGLKENVICGHLIPAGTGHRTYEKIIVGSMQEYESLVASKTKDVEVEEI